MTAVFSSMFEIPSSVTFQNTLFYLLFVVFIYGQLNEYKKHIAKTLKEISDFGKDLAEEFYKYVSTSDKIRKEANVQVSELVGSADDVKIRVESLESAFKNLVLNESKLLEEQLEDIKLLKQNAWTTKSKEKYTKIERATSRRRSIYQAAEKFTETKVAELV